MPFWLKWSRTAIPPCNEWALAGRRNKRLYFRNFENLKEAPVPLHRQWASVEITDTELLSHPVLEHEVADRQLLRAPDLSVVFKLEEVGSVHVRLSSVI